MKKIIIAIAAAVALTGCAAITPASVQIGAAFFGAVVKARADHPDSFKERVPVYANLYCDLRQEHGLEWQHAREMLDSNGISESHIAALWCDTVESESDVLRGAPVRRG